jgi:hypothetical protein
MDEKKVYICANNHAEYAVGRSLKEAYDDFADNVGDIRPEELTFYEAVEIEIEVQFVKKEVVKKITAAKK